MDLVPKSRVTKGKLGGMSFLYNPNQFHDSLPVTYNDIKSAGMSYPVFGYGGGDRRTVTFEIYLNDKVQKGITEKFIAHLHSFLPPARKKGYQFREPNSLVFAFGWFVKTCKLVDLQIDYLSFTADLKPMEATVQVTLAVEQ